MSDKKRVFHWIKENGGRRTFDICPQVNLPFRIVNKIVKGLIKEGLVHRPFRRLLFWTGKKEE